MDARKLSLEELDRLEVEEFKAIEKTPIIVILDDIRSALNVGSFFRTSDALALKELVLCGITAKPPHKEILKTAIGATESVDWKYVESITDALESYKNESVIISVEQTDKSITLETLENKIELGNKPVVLIFGNEVHGVSDEAINNSTYCVEIPQFGTKHSLNVSVCGGIVLWEFWKLMNTKS